MSDETYELGMQSLLKRDNMAVRGVDDPATGQMALIRTYDYELGIVVTSRINNTASEEVSRMPIAQADPAVQAEAGDLKQQMDALPADVIEETVFVEGRASRTCVDAEGVKFKNIYDFLSQTVQVLEEEVLIASPAIHAESRILGGTPSGEGQLIQVDEMGFDDIPEDMLDEARALLDRGKALSSAVYVGNLTPAEKAAQAAGTA